MAKGITVFCQLLHGARLSPEHSISAASGGAADVEILSVGGEKKKNIPKIGHAEQGWGSQGGQAALVSVVGGC